MRKKIVEKMEPVLTRSDKPGQVFIDLTKVDEENPFKEKTVSLIQFELAMKEVNKRIRDLEKQFLLMSDELHFLVTGKEIHGIDDPNVDFIDDSNIDEKDDIDEDSDN